MKQNKSILVVVTIFFSYILLSGIVNAQSFSGYKDFRFGMKRNEIIPILNRVCMGAYWDANEKYQELTKTKDGAIQGYRCYSIFGKYRDVYFIVYSDTKELYQIKVSLGYYDRKKPNDFIKHYYRVNKLLRKKYKLEIPINEELYKRFLDWELEKVYEIYNDGKVVLSFEHRKIGRYTLRTLFVIYNNNHLAGNAVDFAKKSMSAESDDF